MKQAVAAQKRRLDFIGGTYIFKNTRVRGLSGALNRNCVVGLDGLASGFAHDVADEEKFHTEDLTTKPAKDTKRNQGLLG